MTVSDFSRNIDAERRQAEEALEESLEQIVQAKWEWESTADSLSQLVCLLDPRGRVIRANRTVESWNLGRVVDVSGRSLHELMHSSCTDQACYLETRWPLAWEEVAHDRAAEFEAEDRVLERHLRIQVQPISRPVDRRRDKATSFAVVVVHDVTRQKQDEAALRSAREELERRVEERTAELLKANVSLRTEIAERKRAEDALRGRAEQLATLHATSLEIIKPHDLTTLLHTIVERAARLLHAAGGGLYLCDPDRAEARCVVSYNSPRDYAGMTLKYGEGAAGTVAKTGEPLIIDDYRIWPRPSEGDHAEPLTATLNVPLIWQGQVTGVIYLVDDAETRRFTQDDLELLTLLANQAAIAVENARLLETEREQREVAETLREVASVLNTSLDRETVLRRILEQLARVVDYDSASLMLVSRDTLALAAHRSLHPERREFTPLRIDALKHVQETLEDRVPMIISDTTADSRWLRLDGSEYTRCWLGVPLVVQDRVIGLLNLGKRQPHFYTERDAALAVAFADQAAIAIENARLYAEVKQQATELSTMLEAAKAVSSTLELEEVLVLIAKQMVRAIRVSGCTLFRFDREADAVVTWVEWREPSGYTNRPGTVYALKDFPATRTVLEQRQPVTILATDCEADSAEVVALQRQESASLIMLPLVVGDQVIGLVKLDDESERVFTDAEIGLSQALASQAAVAIRNAQLFEEVRAGRELSQILSRQLLAVQESERRHIARELHDEVSQVLTGLKLTLETIRRLPPDVARVRLGKAQEFVGELMARVREMSLDLRPTMLDDAGLVPALLWHFERYTTQTGVAVKFEHGGLERRFPPEVETAAYRIVQEALTNVARHAGVSEVMVRLLADRDIFCVEIEDRGAGFDPETVRRAGCTGGLAGMHERAILLGGHLIVEASPGAGARLTAELPVGEIIEQGERHE